MTDYQPLILRAVEGLGKGTGEARRTLYERARAALVTQLRSVDPPLSESDITRERLSLEEAIRKVEADAARKSRTEAHNEPRFGPRPLKSSGRPAPGEPAPQVAPAVAPQRGHAPPPAGESRKPERNAPIRNEPARAKFSPDDKRQAEAAREESPASARSRLLNARMPSLKQDGIKGFRDVVSDANDLGVASSRAVQSAHDTRDSYEAVAPRRSPQSENGAGPAAPITRFEPQFDAEAWRSSDGEPLQLHSLEPAFDLDEEAPVFTPQPMRPRPPRGAEPDEGFEPARPPRSYRGLIKLAVVLGVLGIFGAALSWQWPNISHFVGQMRTKPSKQVEQAPHEPAKFPGRVPQEQGPAQPPVGGAPSSQTPPVVAQRVVLYEEDPNNPQGRRFVGTAIWRTETVSPGPGLAPELAVRADIEVPDRHMTVTWSLRRNTDPALPASHTIEIRFSLPPDFPGGGISNVPGILMKQSEQARGTPLAGLAVKVTNGYFLIGLSATDTDQQHNIELLKDQEWFDIPIVYTNGGRAILAVEKGPPGDKAFAEAFAAWGK
jgi:hypothetical protein